VGLNIGCEDLGDGLFRETGAVVMDSEDAVIAVGGDRDPHPLSAVATSVGHEIANDLSGS
jgi:hypothetical protein